MNCLVCGHKLAIFRKLSLGDFCCHEHRAVFLQDQSERGLARLTESGRATRSKVAGTRVYAQFMLEELPAVENGPGCLGYGPVGAFRMVSSESPAMSFARLEPARHSECVEPQPGDTSPIGFGVMGLALRLPAPAPIVWNRGNTHLEAAGLILPWSSGAASHSVFSLAPLAAAAWAQSGFCKPISAHSRPAGDLQFVWPSVEARVELPSAGIEFSPAAAAPMAAPSLAPMRVRLATPAVAQPKEKLRLALPVPSRLEDCAAPPPEYTEPAPAAPVRPTTPSSSLLVNLFMPRPRPALASRTRTRLNRDEVFGYDEPVAPKRTPSPWLAMLSGWTPSAAGVSVLFAVLFLFSAVTIFLSAPAAMSYRTPSFRWSNLRSAIRSRAVLMVEDDFRSGLNGWTFPGGWSQDWSYDQAGFLRPGKIGFLQDSMKLVNYRLELMGQIERKSLSWAFRAKDEKNYYVAKLTVSRPGPLPMVDLVHYPVNNGREGAKIRVALPFSVRNDTLYQVEMSVRGDQFRASVNGHVVDSWSDNTLLAGGVGFVTGRGEASRVRWIRVSDRDDVLGRVCSFLSARSYQPASEPVLSASYFTILTHPGL